MNIRTKLTAIFFSIVIVVLTAITLSIYYFSANYRETDFYRRLRNRAVNTAKILVEVEEVNAELLRRMESNNPASLPNQYIVIYNYKNEVLYRSAGTDIIQADTTLLNNIRLQEEVRFRLQDYELLGFLYTEGYERYTVIAGATDVYGRDALNNLRNVLATTFGISMIFVSILGWFFAGKVLRPISRIVSDVDKITAVNLSQRLDEGGKKDELGKLAATFNKMLERLQAAFSAQRNFIANASHEIKTPITVMKAEVEVTLLQDREKLQYVQVLKSVVGGLQGLNKLSTQLLLLAQTSAEESAANFLTIRIDDILWEMKEELLRAFPGYVIEIDFDLKVNDKLLQIYGDEQLIRAAILNLMDNACKYSDNNKVIIELDTGHNNSIIIRFINNGPGIEADSLARIFEPFYRGPAGKKVRGFGIGLSLVSRIVKIHGGSITVDSLPFQKTTFTIELPANDRS
jgi:signal transduction histidine kinase